MAAIAELEVILNRLGIANDAPEADDVARLLDAVSRQYRRRTNRALEGEPTTYIEIVRVNDFGEIRLRHAPVSAITKIERLYADNSVAFTYAVSDYRLEHAERAHILLIRGSRGLGAGGRARVTYVTTGQIDVDDSQAVEDWVVARWKERGREGLASYSTGSDSESYHADLAGLPPASVRDTIASRYFYLGGGVI